MADNKPKKKKRKVGRPKKRGRKPLKKKSSNLKISNPNNSKKGFGSALTYNKVRKLLWETHKYDFSSYKEFISSKYDEDGNKIKGSSIASRVYAECKTQDCLDNDVLNIYNQIFNISEKGDTPQLSEELFKEEAFYYWTIITENWWAGFPDNVWVVAPMLISNPDSFLGIYGEDRYIDEEGNEVDKKDYENYIKNPDKNKKVKAIEGYKNRFQPFVDEGNRIQLNYAEKDSYVYYYKFLGTEDNPEEPYWNELKKRWEIQIVICDSNGNIDSFGFVPDDSFDSVDADKIIDKSEIQEKTQITEEQKNNIEQADIEIKRIEEERKLKEQTEKTNLSNIELEKEKQKTNLSNIELEKEKQKTIDKQMETIKYYKEIGLSIDEIKKILGL